jgi:sugar O-acyltransferase (sialic acid O-acetyltransferase NeuD family)
VAEELVILGAGGSAGDIIWCVEEINRVSKKWTLRGFLDDDPARQGGAVRGYPIMGPLTAVAELTEARFLVGVAHYLRPLVRRDIVQRLQLPSERFATLVHPQAAVAPEVGVGAGTIVFQGTIVCHGASLGDHVFLGYRCVVSHDAVVEDYATLASGAVVCGGGRIEAAGYAGAGSVIKDGVVVGAGAVTGLGSVVFRDVPSGELVVGNPARAVPRQPAGAPA